MESLLITILIGLAAGWIASMIVGGPFGMIGDIIVGLIGAVVGGYLLGALNINMGSGLVSAIVTGTPHSQARSYTPGRIPGTAQHQAFPHCIAP